MKLPGDFINTYGKPENENSTFYGWPLKELSQQEMIAIIHFLHESEQKLRKELNTEKLRSMGITQ